MSDVQIPLSVNEANIYSGACLTYSGVPFHRVEKTHVSPAELDRLDQMFNGFLNARQRIREHKSSRPVSERTTHIELSEPDLVLLIEVMTAVLRNNEPPNEHSDRNLEIHVGPRAEIEKALNKLQQVQQRLQPA